MKTKLPWILTVLLAVALVVVIVKRPATEPAKAATAMPAQHQKKILYWVDPMHPAYTSDKPGKAPDCGMDLVPVYDDGSTGGTAAETPQGYAPVKLAADRQRMIGVQTAVAERRPLGRSIRTVGRVAVDETRQYKVTTKFDGYIDKLYVDYTGKQVHRGQLLFSIYSPELFSAQQEYLLALRGMKQSPTLVDAARQRLKLWDVSDAEIRQLERTGAARKSLTVASPTSGFVLARTAVDGMKVNAGDSLFDIANLDHVWALADVYESDLQFVRVGAPATMTLSYLPGRSWRGRVTFIAPTVDPMTRTVKTRIEFDNPDGALKPDMFADIVIDQPAHDAVVVPDSAVLATGTRSIVFVVAPDGKFVPREVQTGTKSDGFIAITNGVEAGEKVVTQANFLIDSESRLKGVLAEMSSGHRHD